MSDALPSKELTQRDLYKPENVVAYLRSIESNSIAGMQFRRAADEIERLRADLDHAVSYYAQFDLVPKGPSHEPAVIRGCIHGSDPITECQVCYPVEPRADVWDVLQALCDEQNGPPLETRREQWQRAFDQARHLLRERPTAPPLKALGDDNAEE